MDARQEQELRQYAAGDLAWRTMRSDGWSYSNILAGLGELGLRPPMVREHGPNHDAIERGRARPRVALANLRP